MTTNARFPRSFLQSRDSFCAAAADAGLAMHRIDHPLSTAGQPLSCDIARSGPADASRLLILVSGLHGVELFPGSACQIDWLRSGGPDRLPPDTAALLIHAINPWGALTFRRNNEDNVDLGRNFLDFDAPLPDNPAYEQLHGALSLPDMDAVEAFSRQHGRATLVETIMKGQYRHADGFGFGGTAPTWSNRTLRQILREERGQARHVCVLEYHTGLGPYAYGGMFNFQEGADLDRARRWFGDWLIAPLQSSGNLRGHRPVGISTAAYAAELAPAQTTVGIVEFGTVPPSVSLPVMIENHCLTLQGQPGERLDGNRRRMLDCHSPDDADWEQAIHDRARQVIGQALRGLAAA